jgi:hypothetical protein
MIIGLHGPKECGKNTAAQLLTDYYYPKGYEIKELSFAKKLKASALEALEIHETEEISYEKIADLLKQDGKIHVNIPGLNWVDEDDNPIGSSFAITGREYLQYYGTEAHREIFGQDFWVDAALPKDYVDNPASLTLVTDVRFPNEAERIKKLNGRIIQIVRPGYGEGDAHASEKPLPLDLIDATVSNGAGFQELQDSLVTIVGEWLK